MHLLWKRGLLPLKVGASRTLSNRKLANQPFMAFRLVLARDGEMPGLNMLGPTLCIWHKGRAEISNTFQSRKVVGLHPTCLNLEEILVAKTTNQLNYVPCVPKLLLFVGFAMGKKFQTIRFKILLRCNLTKKSQLR